MQPAAAQHASDVSIKAAYLYNFLSYVEWPPDSLPAAGAPFVLGVAGADGVRDELQAIVVGRKVHGHPIVIRALGPSDPPEGLHVVFIGRDVNPARLLERLRGRPVLVITDLGNGREPGSMLNFVPVQGRIRFEASPTAAERSGLKLGSRLLAVAERVLTQ